MIIVGYKEVDFSDKVGNKIEGVTVHVAFEAPADHGKGMLTDHFFVSKQKFSDLHIAQLHKNNTEIELLYNKYGKVDSVREVV